MRPDRMRAPLTWASALAVAVPLLLLGAVGCDGDDNIQPTGSTSGTGGGGGEGPQGPPASPKAIARFKGPKRMQAELSRALEIAPELLCQELGQYDCFPLHGVVLGGTDAFGVGLYEPLPSTTSTTPISVDRVVLSACTQRALMDFGTPDQSLIFKDLTLGAGGELADVNEPAVATAIDVLYQRALSRRAKPSEVDHLRGLYTAIVNNGKSSQPARDWAALSCLAVLTTTEALFY